MIFVVRLQASSSIIESPISRDTLAPVFWKKRIRKRRRRGGGGGGGEGEGEEEKKKEIKRRKKEKEGPSVN